jgi:hypothetical protein
MDGNNAPRALYHELNQKCAGGKGSPGIWEYPERDEAGAKDAGCHDCCSSAKELGVVPAHLDVLVTPRVRGVARLTVPPITAPVFAITVALEAIF